MRNFIFALGILSISLFAFKSAGEEHAYSGPVVSYKVAKEQGVVKINLDLKQPDQLDELVVMRSENPAIYFRSIKQLNQEAISKLTHENVLIDKYPLPSSVVTYYKVQTVDKSGVQRSYPSVKLTSK